MSAMDNIKDKMEILFLVPHDSRYWDKLSIERKLEIFKQAFILLAEAIDKLNTQNNG